MHTSLSLSLHFNSIETLELKSPSRLCKRISTKSLERWRKKERTWSHYKPREYSSSPTGGHPTFLSSRSNVERGRPLFHFSFSSSLPSGPSFTRNSFERVFPRVQKQPSYYYRVRTDCSRVIRVAVCFLRHVPSLSSLIKHRLRARRPFS